MKPFLNALLEEVVEVELDPEELGIKHSVAPTKKRQVQLHCSSPHSCSSYSCQIER
jgi:hypothetical protein